MRRKYPYLCGLGSLIVMLLVVGVCHAAEIEPKQNSVLSAKPNSNRSVDRHFMPHTFHAELLADASSATEKRDKKSRQKLTVPSEKRLMGGYDKLDDETERLLTDILKLSSDFAILEEELNTPAKHQLLVLVTMKPSKLFKLDYVELKIDNHTVAAYNYTPSDVRALTLGGGHRLYLALLPSGKHQLSATMAGRIPRDPDYNKAVEHSFISGQGRTIVELIVTSEQSNSFPVLAVKEWNQ